MVQREEALDLESEDLSVILALTLVSVPHPPESCLP